MSRATASTDVLAAVTRFLQLLWRDGDVREFRAPKHNRYRQTASGYFDRVAAFAEAAAAWDGRVNVYVTLNPVAPALLARAANRIDEAAEHTTSDVDVLRRRWFVLDIDPDRPAGISSTDAELEAGRVVLDAAIAVLEAAGAGRPIVALSGNGYYAFYAIDLPNDDAALALLSAVLEALGALCDTDAAHIDPTVGNASRIIGIVGLRKVKGDPLPDRPHRRSALLEVPADLPPVPQDVLEAVAARAPGVQAGTRQATPNPGAGPRRLAEWLAEAGIPVQTQPPDARGYTWYHLRRCPLHDDGADFECGVGERLSDGQLAGHCFHPEGQGKGWQDFKQALGLTAGSAQPAARPPLDLEASRTTLREALAGIRADPGLAFDPEVLGALALVRQHDPSEFARARQHLQKARVSLRDLDDALRSRGPTLHVLRDHGQPDGRAVHTMLTDAPGRDLIVPKPYFLRQDLTGYVTTDKADNLVEIVVAYAPLLITRRLRDIDDGAEHLRLDWRRPHGWQGAVVDRGTVLDARQLTPLAGAGFPVGSDTARAAVHYLHAFEARNYAAIPQALVSSHLGWQGADGARGFLWGRTLLHPDGRRTGILHADAAVADDWQEDWVAFHGPTPGDDQIADGYHAAGTLEGWCAAVAPILRYPRVLAGFYASFVPPLLTILHAPNFIVDLANRTSTGKTTVQRVAASIWGKPDERAADAAIGSWDATRVWVERASAVVSGLPLILDDTKRAKDPRLVADLLYAVANGRGRGRGNPKGLARTRTWHTVLISSGEAPAVSFTQDGGTRMRCLTLRGLPFGSGDADTRRLVEGLNLGVLAHYGHAGPRFVQYLQQRDRWAEWEALYRQRREEYAGSAASEEAGRMAHYVAAIDVAAAVAHAALPLPWDWDDPLASLWADLSRQAADAAGELRALQDVMSWAYAHQESFWGRAAVANGDGAVRIPPQGWSGAWQGGQDWESIAFLPTVLREVLTRLGYQPEAILAGWQELDWLASEGDRRHPYTRRVSLNGERVRCMVITRTAITAADA